MGPLHADCGTMQNVCFNHFSEINFYNLETMVKCYMKRLFQQYGKT